MTQWIKCSDRFPDGECTVLTFGSFGIGTSYYHRPFGNKCLFQDVNTNNDEGMRDFFDDDSPEFRVTHWMPLPQPPEE